MSDAERWIAQPEGLSKGFLAGVDRVIAVLCVTGFSLMAVIIAIQVIARYAFNSPTIWSEELAISLFVWSTMLAIPLGLRRGEHLTLDLMARWLTPKVLRWVALITALVTGAVMLFLGYLTLGLLAPADRQLLAGIAGGLGIQAKVSWVYLAVPVGGVLSAVFATERAIQFFRGRIDTLAVDADQAVIEELEAELGETGTTDAGKEA